MTSPTRVGASSRRRLRNGRSCEACRIRRMVGNHAHRWLGHAVTQLQRQGVTVQVQPLERLGGPILAHGPRNPFHQFLAVGLHPLGLAFCLLVVHDIHSNLFSCFSIAHLKDLQNQTMIFHNYSTIRCEGASIITTRERTCFSALAGKLDFSSRRDAAALLGWSVQPSAAFTSIRACLHVPFAISTAITSRKTAGYGS